MSATGDDLFLLVESNTTGTGALFPAAARRLGLRPVLITADPGRYPFSASLDVVRIDTGNVEDVVAACRQLGDAGRVAGVTTSSEYFLPVVSVVADRLGLPGHPPAVIDAVRDKGIQRVVLATGGVRVPHFAVVSSVLGAVEAAARIGLPVVVKPVAGSGSAGVRLCATAHQVTAHADELLAEAVNERGQPVARRVLVEELAQGPEYSVEVFGRETLGVTRKHLGALPAFVETGHDFPAPLPEPARRRLAAAALRAAGLLGLTLGPAHVELRDHEGEPVLIEVNARLAGGQIPRLVAEAIGIDLVQETVRAFSGTRPIILRSRDRGASIRFVLAPSNGVLECFDGLEAARRVPGVTEVHPYREAGSQLRVTGDFRDRIGHVIACAGDVLGASTAAETAVGRIRPMVRALRECAI